MKLKIVAGSIFALTLGLIGVAHANAVSSYYPPERIHCMLSGQNEVSCDEFNRQYLVEDTSNADLQQNRHETFHFVSGAAYFTPDQKEAVIFYTYNNHHYKMVKLKTINPNIRPDLFNGNWRKVAEDIYTCDAGYMSCPITNLPAF